MQKLKTKEFWVNLVAFLIGVVGIALVIMQICYVFPSRAEFSGQEESYLADTVPNGFAYLTYYTNITLLLFCIYAVVKFVAVLFGFKKLEDALNNRYVLLFLAVNELIVLVVYTAMMFVFKFSMFKYAPTPHNLHDIGSSIFKHFFVTIFAVVYCLCTLRNDPERGGGQLKRCLWFVLYPLAYFVMVQIVGRACYEYNWFPYPFFATDQIWLTLFGSLSNFNFSKALWLLLGCYIVILVIYVLAIVLCCVLSERLKRGRRNRMVRGILCAKTKN